MSSTTQGFNSPEQQYFLAHLQKLLDSNERDQIQWEKYGEEAKTLRGEITKQGERIGEHTLLLKGNGERLDEHTHLLKQHGERLHEHTLLLKGEQARLDRHEQRMDQLRRETKCLRIAAMKSVAGQVHGAAELLKHYQEVAFGTAGAAHSTNGPQQRPQQP